jgi:hypothetical protein
MAGATTVFFLGAGASADAGVPQTRELLTRIVTGLRRGGRTRVQRDVLVFIARLGFAKGDEAGRAPIVDVISLLDSCLQENRPLDRKFTVERLREVRTCLISELSKAIQVASNHGVKVLMPKDALDQPGAEGRRVAQYLKRFARSLRPRSREAGVPLGAGDAIITTNYDTQIDVAVFELAYWNESGGKPGVSRLSDVFLGSAFRDPYEDVDALSEPANVVDLFKLHGSLNWLYCPCCMRAYIAAFCDSVQLLEFGPEDEQTCFCGYMPLEPVIVAPSVFQDVGNPHLQAIWMNAYQVLERADQWVFVGYSLPAEDLAVRSLLYRAFQARRQSRRGTPRVKVVCPKESLDDVKRRYQCLFGSSIECDGRRFCEFVFDTPIP